MNASEIESFMLSINFKPATTRAEIKQLPEILHPEEKLLGLLEGWLKKIHTKTINGNGLVIATDRRVIFYRKSMIGTVTKEETPISKISSVSYRKGLVFASISVVTSNNESEVENCTKDQAKKFIDVLQALIADKPATAAPVTAAAPDDSLVQLEKLFDLKNKGIITEDEYTAKKMKLLGI